MRIKKRTIKVIDDVMARVLREKTPQQRLAIAFGMWSSARKQLSNYLRMEYSNWSEAQIQEEVARRMSHGAVREPGNDLLAKYLLVIFLSLTCLSCAGLRKPGIEAQLISEMERDCRKVEVKRDHEGAVYVIAYTGKGSKGKCPLALIRGWKDDKIIMEKEVEVCGCKKEKADGKPQNLRGTK